MEEEESSKLKGPKIFGKHLADIPCFRDSYLYGISTGIGTGLATFMFSSRPRLGYHLGLTAFVVTTVSYWTYCRHYWEKEVQNSRLLKEFIKQQVLEDGVIVVPSNPGIEGPISVSEV